MRKRKYNVGDVFGNREIIEYPYQSKKVLVRCVECGNESWIYISNLTNGASKQCWECRKHDPREATYKMCLRTAKRRGIQWDLDFETWSTMASDTCFYCGAEPANSCYDFPYNGIDRVDSGGIYEVGNVVTACKVCNRAKSDMTQELFYEWIGKVYGRL
jgi:hypothetical protein